MQIKKTQKRDSNPLSINKLSNKFFNKELISIKTGLKHQIDIETSKKKSSL